MIRVYEGGLGSGKTLNMVADALRLVKLEGRPVYTNMKSLRFPGQCFIDTDHPEDIELIRTGLCLFDEAQLAFSGRFWQGTSKSTLGSFAQLRKNGLDLYATTQDFARIDTVLREITQELVSLRRLGRWTLRTSGPPGNKHARTRRLILRPPVHAFALYDTLEVLGSSRAGAMVPDDWVTAAAAERTAAGRSTARAAASNVDPWRAHAMVWNGNEFRMTKQARETQRWLRARGLALPGDPDGPEILAAEIRRRNWLKVFLLNGDGVPMTVTPEWPWSTGNGPDRLRLADEPAPLEVKPRRSTRRAA